MLGASVAILLAAASLDLVQPAAVDQRTCYDPQRDMYPYFGTRTAYQQVRGNFSRAENSCKPLQVWMLCRHGTRYPGEATISKILNDLPAMRDQIVKNHEQGAGLLCDEDLQKFKEWKLDENIRKEVADVLAPQGMDDLRLLAQRLQRAFPELLKVDGASVQPDDFVFRSTDTERTKASLKSFATGLFGDSTVARIIEPPVNDTLLLPFENCAEWQTTYDKIRTNVERDNFTAGPEFQNLLLSISRRLGYDKPFNLETIMPMYELCRFESALYLNRTPVWCSVFNKEELMILEYRVDLSFYYCCGPGRKTSAKMGCPLLSDMFKHFKQLASGSTSEPKGIFYFAHTLTLQVFMAALKVDDGKEPPLASTYVASANRKFRTSIRGPFATNVVAVFYRCNGGTNKVTFHVAENLMPLASCNEDGTCDWDTLEHDFDEQINECNMGFCTKEATRETVNEELLEFSNINMASDNKTIAASSRADRFSENIFTFATAMIFALRMTVL